MVAAHGRDVGGARLFPSRDDERRALLALPSRRWGREHNGRSELVHPWRVRMTDRSAIPTTTYVEVQVTRHFSFLRGASAPEELFAAAALHGHGALGLCDRGSVAGRVRGIPGQQAPRARLIPDTNRKRRVSGQSELVRRV